MTWITIEPDWLNLSPVHVTTSTHEYLRHVLAFDGTTARLADGTGTVWEEATPDRIEQDQRNWSWRLYMGDVVWTVSRASGCACGSLAPVPLNNKR